MVLLSTARGRRQRYVPLRRIEVSRGAHDCFVLPGIYSRKNLGVSVELECYTYMYVNVCYATVYMCTCTTIFFLFLEMLHLQ